MHQLILVALAVLATYRVARMLALEDGPFDLFVRVRARIDPEQITWVGRGINCPLCISFWVALVFALLLPFVDWQTFVMMWLGVAGGAAFAYRLAD